KASKPHLLFADDAARGPAGGPHADADLDELFAEPAGGNVAAQIGDNPGFASTRAFERQAGRAPVGLAGGVVMCLTEADALEPPRGPWARVSLIVVAVDDHRPPALELSSRLAVEFLERDVDRTRQVLLL